MFLHRTKSACFPFNIGAVKKRYSVTLQMSRISSDAQDPAYTIVKPDLVVDVDASLSSLYFCSFLRPKDRERVLPTRSQTVQIVPYRFMIQIVDLCSELYRSLA